MLSHYSVKICDTNPYRWYVSFKQNKPVNLRKVRLILEKNRYQTLASTPTVMVFQSDSNKLTWHSHGLLQVDFIDQQRHEINSVEDFVNSNVDIVTDAKRLRPKKSEVKRLFCKNQKLIDLTGYKPTCTLEEGLSKTIEWFKGNMEGYKPDIYNV